MINYYHLLLILRTDLPFCYHKFLNSPISRGDKIFAILQVYKIYRNFEILIIGCVSDSKTCWAARGDLKKNIFIHLMSPQYVNLNWKQFGLKIRILHSQTPSPRTYMFYKHKKQHCAIFCFSAISKNSYFTLDTPVIGCFECQ